MLMRMKAVVTPQHVVNGCRSAVQATGLGRGSMLVNDLPITHFTFVVHPDEYDEVSAGLRSLLTSCVSYDSSPLGRIMMGSQEQVIGGQPISWFYSSPVPNIVVTTDEHLQLQAGGGFVTVRTPDLASSYHWLVTHGVQFTVIPWGGKDALWVPLITPDYGVGEGVYALMVVTDTLDERSSIS